MPTAVAVKPEWDVHQHKGELHVSAENTIYHVEQGQLCWFERPGHLRDFLSYVLVAHPIRFKDAVKAHAWIKNGCIGDLQVETSRLQIGFSVHSIQVIER